MRTYSAQASPPAGVRPRSWRPTGRERPGASGVLARRRAPGDGPRPRAGHRAGVVGKGLAAGRRPAGQLAAHRLVMAEELGVLRGEALQIPPVPHPAGQFAVAEVLATED